MDKLRIESATQKLLIKNIEENKLPNTLIFYGPKHTGKLTSAYSIAKILNCLEKTNDFCNICTNCNKINYFSHPDIAILNSYITTDKINSVCGLITTNNNPKLIKALRFYFDELTHSFLENQYNTNSKPKPDTIKKIDNTKALLHNCKNINKVKDFEKTISSIQKVSDKIYSELNQEFLHIESIRNIIKKIYIKPIETKNKITIINGVENMKIETANTLLKAIEEPPIYNTIILITRDINKVIHTIRSRASAIYFPPLDKKLIPKILKDKLGINKHIVEENNSIWDYIKKQNNIKHRVEEFITEIAPNYAKGNKLFIFTDKLLEDNIVDDFLKEIISLLRNANIIKYNLHKNKEIKKDNPFYALNAKELDNIKNQIEETIANIEHFNANASLNLSGFLITLARKHNEIKKKI